MNKIMNHCKFNNNKKKAYFLNFKRKRIKKLKINIMKKYSNKNKTLKIITFLLKLVFKIFLKKIKILNKMRFTKMISK